MGKFMIGDVRIDAGDFAVRGNAVLGIRDSGKTYTATLLAEKLFDFGVPFIAFDPVGVWRFLRVPGAGKGYPIIVAGGQDGDLPLSVENAPLIVRAVMESGASLVIDLFDMTLSKADWRRIVMSCVKLLLHENAKHGVRHVFIEEAAEFIPQKVIDGHVYAEVEKLARMGGNSRLGLTVINQRAEELNKAVLELCDNLFLHRQKGRRSLEALTRWLDVANVKDGKSIIDTLSTLPTGECWAWLHTSERPVHVKVQEKNSLHPDRRIMHGDVAKPKPPLDIAKLLARIQDSLLTQTRAKMTPAETMKPVAAKPASSDEIAAARKAGYDSGYAEGLERGERWAKLALGKAADAMTEALRVVGLERDDGVPAEPTPGLRAEMVKRLNATSPPPQKATPAKAVSGEGELRQSHQRVIDALALWDSLGFPNIQRNRASVVAGYSPKASTFGVYISELAKLGLVISPAPGALALTDAGRRAAKFMTGASVRDMARSLLKPQEVRVFDVVCERWPNDIHRHDLADAMGLSRTASTLGVYISASSTLGLIETPRPGHVRAVDWLFPGPPAL